jgi:hypothetical protein
MAKSGFLVVASVFMLLAPGIKSATLTSEKDTEKLMRKEQLSPKRVDSQPQAAGKLKVQYCDYDFPLGKPGTSQCANGKTDGLIDSPDMCREAAAEAGATTLADVFLIDDTPSQNTTSKGCFKSDCPTGRGKVCYYYNPIGDWPQLASDGSGAVTGTPVCHRPKYELGGANSNEGCPADDNITGSGPYKLIEDEYYCRNTGVCLGDARASNFKVGEHNATQQRDFSNFCFLDKTGANHEGTYKVYYNPKSKYIEGMSWGTDVKGTPICQVSSTVKWCSSDGSQCGAATEGKCADGADCSVEVTHKGNDDDGGSKTSDLKTEVVDKKTDKAAGAGATAAAADKTDTSGGDGR